MATPVRDFWPLTPRPAVLPLPEPMPRPTRMRPLRDPGLSAISFSLIVRSSAPWPPTGCLARFLVDAQQMAHLVDHAAHLGRIHEFAAAMALVQSQPDQCCALIVCTADVAARLGDLDLLAVGHGRFPYAASTAVSSRRPSRSPTFLPRRVATMRGELSCCSAWNVALIMLCGLDVPTDLATMSLRPSVSNTARIGPPAMMPGPAGAERSVTLPAPKRPLTSWCSVRPSRSGTRISARLAASVALRIASGTSRALPATEA